MKEKDSAFLEHILESEDVEIAPYALASRARYTPLNF